jgi:hypothetical protein
VIVELVILAVFHFQAGRIHLEKLQIDRNSFLV